LSINTAIEEAMQIQSGEHMVILYEQEEEMVEYLSAYIHSSLIHNKRCIYITNGDMDESIVLERVESLSLGREQSGDFIVLNKEEAYSKEGRFNPDKMIDFLRTLVEEAIAEGYSGLAVTGEISWVMDYENGRELIIEYEWKLNEQIFDRYPVTALCRYNMTKFSDEMIINIIQLHPYLIWQNTMHQNPFYIEPEGYKNNEIAKYQVQAWLQNINGFTNEKSRFRNMLSKKEKEMEEFHKATREGIIKAMVELLSTHDAYTNNHSENVADLTSEFGKQIGLTEEALAKAYYAGMVHDIGKTLIPREILNKKTKLTEAEYAEVKKHPVYGGSALGHVAKLKEISKAIHYHHERWDGRGYPEGLAVEEIPQLSRMLCIVDAFDAMTDDRPYRKAFTEEHALAEISACAGKQIDPVLAGQFIAMIKENNAKGESCQRTKHCKLT